MKKTKIIFLILPGVHLLDLAGPDQAFLEAIELGADWELVYCSVDKNILTSSRLAITKLTLFSKVTISQGDHIFIPGAPVTSFTAKNLAYESEIKKWLQEGYQKGAFICSVCTGAFLLARLGLLDGKNCTTHWKRTKELQQLYPAVKVQEDILFTTDERICTSAGVTAGIDLSLQIISNLKGDHFSFTVARELVVYNRRNGNDMQQSVFMQYRNHIHSGIHRLQDYLGQFIHRKVSLTKLSHIACMSERNLTRIFKKETGITVHAYISLLRKEYLQQLLADPDITRKQMAALCGLTSERQVTRLLKNTPY